MIKWPEQLIEDLARRRAILFLGAGVSASSVGADGQTPPTWEQFLRAGIARCSKPTQHIAGLLKRGDFLTACELIKTRLRDEWGPLIEEQFRVPRYQHAPIHEHVFRLDVRIILTQNFDKIYDTYAQSESKNTVTVKNYYDEDVATVLREAKYVIVKAHGTIDHVQKMIFTRSEYAKARYTYSAFYEMLDAVALTNTILFVGCGLEDPDVQMLLQRQAHRFPLGRPHYMCAPKHRLHREVATALEDTYNLNIMTYSGHNRHEELVKSVEDLVRLVEDRRGQVAEQQRW